MYRLLVRVDATTAIPLVSGVDGTSPSSPALNGDGGQSVTASEEAELAQRLVRAETHLFKRHAHRTQCDTASPIAGGSSTTEPVATDSLAPPCATATAATTAVHLTHTDAHQSRQLLLLAIPHLLSTTHLLRHLAGLPLSSVRSSSRLIDSRSGQHSLLLRFHSTDDATTFYQRIHNHAFHAQRREMAYVIYIDEHDVEEQSRPAAGDAESQIAATSACPSPPPSSCQLELPTCPRCLSKLDSSVTDIVTELDEFSVVRYRPRGARSRSNSEAEGPSKPSWTRRRIPIWPEIDCRTCRLAAHTDEDSDRLMSCPACSAASPEVAHACASSTSASASAVSPAPATPSPPPPPPPALASGDNSIWICLLCGHVGCGRYASSGGRHAFAHFQSTRHNYAMESTMGHIWDYANDGYIHRVHGHSLRRGSLAAPLSERRDDSDEQKADSQATSPHDIDPELRNWTGWNEVTPAASSECASSHEFRFTSDSVASLSLLPDSEATHALRAASDDPYSVPDYGLDVEEESALLHSKLESIATFYNELLTEQLKRQYDYFMDRAQEVKEADERQRAELEPRMAARLQQLRSETEQLGTTLADIDVAQRALDRTVRDLAARVSKRAEENAFLKELNRSLLADEMARKKREKEATKQAEQVTTNHGATANTTSETNSASASTSAASAPAASSTTAAASSSSSSSSSSAPSPLSDLDPLLVSKYTNLRDEKSKRLASLEKEVARMMEEIESRTKKETMQQQQAEAARKQRVSKATSSDSSARGRRG